MLSHLPAKTHLLRATTNVRPKAFPKPQGTCLLTTTSPRHVTARPYSSSPSSSLGSAALGNYKSSLPARAHRSVLLPSRPPSLFGPTCIALSPNRRTYVTNTMASVKVGDTIPQGTFNYVPWSAELESNAACGIPIKLNTDEWKGKKVVLVAVPGAFTPLCHVNHLPPFLEKFDELKAKGVDVVAVVAANDAFVQSGWARFLGLKDKILALSDPNAKWSAQLGLSQDLSAVDFGTRTKRYALIIDDLKVTYVGVETERGVTVSGADAVLAAL